jgi:hypothetical protein
LVCGFGCTDETDGGERFLATLEMTVKREIAKAKTCEKTHT